MEREKMTFFEFCERLKNDGAYIGEDGHIYRNDGRPLSRQCRNGYYLLRKNYDGNPYYYCEHRVIWYFYNGKFDEKLTVHHKDFDRTNNRIENLKLVSQKDNIEYSKEAGRLNAAKGEKSAKALFTNKEVQAIRMLAKNGWTTEQIKFIFNETNVSYTIRRIINGGRYGNVLDAADIISVYPVVVMRTWRQDLPKEERIKNALMGMAGEIGEIIDLYKKHFYQGHDLDSIKVMLELGDILYYICAFCIEMDIDFSEICYANMCKLYERYPEGFDEEKSLNRKEGDI